MSRIEERYILVPHQLPESLISVLYRDWKVILAETRARKLQLETYPGDREKGQQGEKDVPHFPI